MLILDQSDAESPWYAAFSAGLSIDPEFRVREAFSVYSEHLDLSRFPGAEHHEARRNYLQDKYRDRPLAYWLPRDRHRSNS